MFGGLRLRVAPENRKSAYMAFWSVVIGLASISAPLLGGVFITLTHDVIDLQLAGFHFSNYECLLLVSGLLRWHAVRHIRHLENVRYRRTWVAWATFLAALRRQSLNVLQRLAAGGGIRSPEM